MDSNTVIALAGVGGTLIGSAIGGLVSFFSSRSMRRLDWQLTQAEQAVSKREALYAEFLTEATRMMLLAIESKSDKSTVFSAMAGLEARIWLYSDSVGEAARELIRCVLIEHSATPEQTEKEFPHLRDAFVVACKTDLQSVRSA